MEPAMQGKNRQQKREGETSQRAEAKVPGWSNKCGKRRMQEWEGLSRSQEGEFKLRTTNIIHHEVPGIIRTHVHDT